MHSDPSPLAGQEVKIRAEANEIGGATLRVEDWWDRAYGGSWTTADGNPAALRYAMRSALGAVTLPLDDEVLYGKIGGRGYLVHMREIEVAE